MATEGFGSINWWGFSPAVDLLSLNPPNKLVTSSGGAVNILLCGCGDLRHLFMTVAMATKDVAVPLHFYIIESHLELLARHLLFLLLLAEPPDVLGVREKAELFLELFGNGLIRGHTSHYTKEKANELIKLITDLDRLQVTLPHVDVSALKFKERDLLEGIFKFWRNPEEVFDFRQHWEGRLRHFLGTRYDARSGTFDWDYHMRLLDLTPLVQKDEYANWRETGVAFQLRDDAPYETSNRTLTNGSLVRQRGETVARRGYWGDTVNSPYIAFGTRCHSKDMLEKTNGKYTKSCQEICEYNIQCLFTVLTANDGQPSVESEQRENAHKNGPSTSPLLDGKWRVTLLPLNAPTEVWKKAKYQNFFDYAYFSNSMVHHLPAGIGSTLAPDATLVCETARFMLDLKKEHKDEYMRKITEMARNIGFIRQLEVDEASLALVAFTKAGE